MLTAFSTALSALKGDSTAVNVISNNLANLNTTGFKEGTVSFSDLVGEAYAGGNQQAGVGVAPVRVTHVFSQGAIQTSSGNLDAAIQGNGFFVLQTPAGQQLFTRDGSFKVDSSGNLMTASGQYVQGWSESNGSVNTNTPIGNIVLPSGTVRQPSPTTQFSFNMNLQSTAAVGATSGSFSSPIQIVDSLGQTHVLSVNFTKTGSGAWNYQVTIPGEDLTSGTAGTPSELAKGSLTFDSNGRLTSPAPPPAGTGSVPISLSGLTDGAGSLSIKWNLFDPKTGASLISQVDQSSGVASNFQDGAETAQLAKLNMTQGGQVTATYSNGLQKVVATLALAEFRNPDELNGAGNNNLQASSAAGLPSIGTAATGGRGDVVGGSLEGSTVDIATEFTNLIIMQRGYQANGKVITTADQISQETINLKQ